MTVGIMYNFYDINYEGLKQNILWYSQKQKQMQKKYVKKYHTIMILKK